MPNPLSIEQNQTDVISNISKEQVVSIDLETIKKNISDIKSSVQEMNQEKELIDKDKSTLDKSIFDQKQKALDDKKIEIESKKKETLQLINKIKIDTKLLALDAGVSQEIADDEKYLKELDVNNKNWFIKQWDGVTDKQEWREHTWSNVARVATGFGVAALARKGVKSLFGIGKKKEKSENSGDKSDNKEEKNSKSFWKTGFGKFFKFTGIGTAAYYLSHGFYTGKWNLKSVFDWMKEPFSFDEALVKVETDLHHISESNQINVDRGPLKYDGKALTTYGISTPLDKYAKSIPGLNIKFSDYAQLIHATNLINYIKHKFTGRCKINTPFSSGMWTGDYYIDTKDGPEEIISGGIFSTLSTIAPNLLNGVFSDRNNKDHFLNYLNSSDCWGEGTPNHLQDNGDLVQQALNDAATQIESTAIQELGEQGNIRKTPEAKKISPTEYDIITRGTPPNHTKIALTLSASGAIQSGKVEGLNIEFTNLEELVRTANLTNKIKENYRAKCGKDSVPFTYKNGFITFGNAGVYVNNEGLPDRVIKTESLEQEIPFLYKNIDIYVAYLNSLKKDGKSWWVEYKS